MKRKNLLKTMATIAFTAVFTLNSCDKDPVDDGNGNGNGNGNETPKTTANFNEIELEAESFWNGSDDSGGFTSGNIFFTNYFTDWGDGVTSWAGFSVSNITDNETPGFANEYSAITGVGYNGNSNYAVVYVSDPTTFENHMKFELTGKAIGNKIAGMTITNSTWAAFTIEDGDDFNDAFEQGDFFLATFTGYFEGTSTGTVDFYLADYRSSNTSEHYIINMWEWVDLKSLGDVDELKISLTSSRNGDWGMETPAYICIGQVITFDE